MGGIRKVEEEALRLLSVGPRGLALSSSEGEGEKERERERFVSKKKNKTVLLSKSD